MTFYGGAETVIVKLAKYINRCGHRVAILSRYICSEIRDDLGEIAVISQPNAPPKESIPRWLANNVSFLSKHVRAIQKEYDVINAHNFPSNWTSTARKPVVWMCNEPPHIVLRMDSLGFKSKDFLKRLLFPPILSLDRILSKRIAKSVVADAYNRSRFAKLYGIDPAIVPYGIDWNYYADGEPDPDFEFKNSFTILQVGIMTQEKNQLASLAALKTISKSIPNAVIIFAGTGEDAYKSRLDEFARSNNLQDRVVFIGHAGKARIRYFYHNCDLLLHPVKAQGGWLAPFEAIAAGLPVIVSTELTASSIISANNLGVVANDFAQALMNFYLNPGKHRAVAHERSEWVKKNLSWDIYSSSMLKIFESVA
jgi:glycosyltransferase involved in cell wall biosynthesis